MRALIGLYNQAGSFITPQTLDRAIDEAFLTNREFMVSGTDKRERSHSDLIQDLEKRRANPKLSNGESDDVNEIDYGGYEEGSWSSKMPERVRQLKAALYGTEPSTDMPKPGYEVLVEEHERIQKLLKQQ